MKGLEWLRIPKLNGHRSQGEQDTNVTAILKDVPPQLIRSASASIQYNM